MSETIVKKERTFRHRDRLSQVPIYLGKQFRFFINESDWKVIPMAMVIAMLVAVVIRNRIFANMEGCIIGSFALTCVALWNGCFNSIQAICRERAIVKREHRSGMHITSYMTAHMIYQFFLCLIQTIVSLYVMKSAGVPFPEEGIFTAHMGIVEFGITLLLISYAADMMSLFISSIAHTTTAAMTVMPFVLIFQLVFSGGVIPLPERVQPLSTFTVSNYGIKAIASQCGYNELPMAAGWTAVNSMKNSEIEETITVGQLMEVLNSDTAAKHSEDVVIPALTAGEFADLLGMKEISEEEKKEILTKPVTLGELTAFANNSETIRKRMDRSRTVKFSVGELLDVFGEENVKSFLQQKTAEAARKPEYGERFILINLLALAGFALLFALLATIALELIDKDKR